MSWMKLRKEIRNVEMHLWIGIVMGVVYFIAKWGLFILVTTKNMRRWIHKHSLVQAALDTVFAYLGMHVFALAGGSVISMIAMIAFAACSMSYIFTFIAIHKLEEVKDECFAKLRF